MSFDVSGGVIEEFRKQIINEAVKDLLDKFTSMVETSLDVLNGSMNGKNGKHEKVLVKMVTKKRKRAKKCCAVSGCSNPFAPRFGGFCVDHRTSSGYRAWRTRRTASQTVATERAELRKAIKAKKSKRSKKTAAAKKAKKR